MAIDDAVIVETTDGDLQVHLPELPWFTLLAEQDLVALEAEYDAWRAEGAAEAEAFRKWTVDVTSAAGSELGERGFWGSKGTTEILEAWTSIRAAADPIYSWVPKEVRARWIRERHGRRVLELYCFRIWSTYTAEMLSLVQAAVLADSLTRATYAALRWRLNHSGKDAAVAAATLRLLAGSDDVAASILQRAGLGPPEVFANEFSREATAVLQQVASGIARARWGLFLNDADEEDEATRNAVNDAVSDSVAAARSSDLLRLALSEVPGHIAAHAASNFAHEVRAIVRQRALQADAFGGEDDSYDPCEVVADPSAQPEASAMVHRDFERFVSRLRDPGDRKLLRIMIENPDARLEDLATAADMPVSTVYRRKEKLRKKFEEFQAIDLDESNSPRPPRKMPT